MAPIDNLLKQVPSFKENIPMWARVTTLLSFVLAFQLSGGIYLASMQQMMGATSLMHEDIMMAALASFTGISIVFPSCSD